MLATERPACRLTLHCVGGSGAGLRYVPYGEMGGAPNVVVDGSPAADTLLCLSHWPGIESPPEFHADLSAQMAFAYADALDRHAGAEIVSNNHFDQDGLVGLFALTFPEAAGSRRDLLIEVARAGDFAVTSSRDAARISMALSAYADPRRSPCHDLPEDYDALTALLYSELLGRLSELCDHPDRYRPLWEEEDASLRATEAALASGAVTIDEVPEVDLAVVTVSPSGAYETGSGSGSGSGGHRFAGQWVEGLHPIGVCSATQRGALLTIRGRRYDLVYRYESWVQFRTRPVRPRVDLAPLALRLNEAEADAGSGDTGGAWVADDVSALTPALRLRDAVESHLGADVVRTAVVQHLRSAPPAWNPYR